MTITASLVLFAVFWFLILFIILPLNIKTQQEEGKRSYGTPTSAPVNANIKKKMILVTLLSLIIWLISNHKTKLFFSFLSNPWFGSGTDF